ncbi:MAG TPA: hypothetical protein VLY63_31425 [Anaerolineae bacterium]|nr:hypothetical protein [Anaerolineae bacterium]
MMNAIGTLDGRIRTIFCEILGTGLMWLHWPWQIVPRMTAGERNLEREFDPFKIRWGRVLLVALALLLLAGELGPAAATF